jgi:hypothetical protein
MDRAGGLGNCVGDRHVDRRGGGIGGETMTRTTLVDPTIYACAERLIYDSETSLNATDAHRRILDLAKALQVAFENTMDEQERTMPHGEDE